MDKETIESEGCLGFLNIHLTWRRPTLSSIARRMLAVHKDVGTLKVRYLSSDATTTQLDHVGIVRHVS